MTTKMKNNTRDFNQWLEAKYNLTILVDFCENICDYPYISIWNENKTATYKIPLKVLKSDTQTQKQWIEKIVTTKFLASQFKRYKYFFNKMNVKGAYIASYGLGVDVWGKADEKMNKVREFLTANKIDFKTELSDQHWVFRFVISKKEENLQRLATTKS